MEGQVDKGLVNPFILRKILHRGGGHRKDLATTTALGDNDKNSFMYQYYDSTNSPYYFAFFIINLLARKSKKFKGNCHINDSFYYSIFPKYVCKYSLDLKKQFHHQYSEVYLRELPPDVGECTITLLGIDDAKHANILVTQGQKFFVFEPNGVNDDLKETVKTIEKLSNLEKVDHEAVYKDLTAELGIQGVEHLSKPRHSDIISSGFTEKGYCLMWSALFAYTFAEVYDESKSLEQNVTNCLMQFEFQDLTDLSLLIRSASSYFVRKYITNSEGFYVHYYPQVDNEFDDDTSLEMLEKAQKVIVGNFNYGKFHPIVQKNKLMTTPSGYDEFQFNKITLFQGAREIIFTAYPLFEMWTDSVEEIKFTMRNLTVFRLVDNDKPSLFLTTPIINKILGKNIVEMYLAEGDRMKLFFEDDIPENRRAVVEQIMTRMLLFWPRNSLGRGMIIHLFPKPERFEVRATELFLKNLGVKRFESSALTLLSKCIYNEWEHRRFLGYHAEVNIFASLVEHAASENGTRLELANLIPVYINHLSILISQGHVTKEDAEMITSFFENEKDISSLLESGGVKRKNSFTDLEQHFTKMIRTKALIN
jgi:hypothetical protein